MRQRHRLLEALVVDSDWFPRGFVAAVFSRIHHVDHAAGERAQGINLATAVASVERTLQAPAVVGGDRRTESIKVRPLSRPAASPPTQLLDHAHFRANTDTPSLDLVPELIATLPAFRVGQPEGDRHRLGQCRRDEVLAARAAAPPARHAPAGLFHETERRLDAGVRDAAGGGQGIADVIDDRNRAHGGSSLACSAADSADIGCRCQGTVTVHCGSDTGGRPRDGGMHGRRVYGLDLYVPEIGREDSGGVRPDAPFSNDTAPVSGFRTKCRPSLAT